MTHTTIPQHNPSPPAPPPNLGTAPSPVIQTHLPLHTRLARFEAPSSDSEERIFNVIFTTGAIVRRYHLLADETYDEELVVDPFAVRLDRLNSGAAPVLDSHSDKA